MITKSVWHNSSAVGQEKSTIPHCDPVAFIPTIVPKWDMTVFGDLVLFMQQLEQIAIGYSNALYEGRRYGVSHNIIAGRTTKFYAEELGGNDHISFNLFTLKTGEHLLKTCEMPKEKVIRFIHGMNLFENEGSDRDK